tara:strand:+ start:5790 stop:6110 length:321 start_codon:yes stop_codon:yes gene_type:complete
MPTTFNSITVRSVYAGCTDKEAPNYDIKASYDDGSCIEKSFGECVNNAIAGLSLQDCNAEESAKYLKVFSVYQSLVEAVKEKNSYKVKMYNEKLAELCTVEHCKSC